MVADVIIAASFSFNGQTETDTDNGGNFFRNEGGTWVLYGNQQVGDFFVSTQARTFQPGNNPPAGTYVFAGANTPVGSVASVIVAGPTDQPLLKIWSNGNSTAEALTRGAQQFQDEQFMDSFFALSGRLQTLNAQVAAGSPFTFTVNTTNLGVKQYFEHTNAVTNETIVFTSFKGGAIPANPLLSTVLNQTVNVTFTWPATYPIGNNGNNFNLFAQVFDGQPNNPASHGCNVGSNPLTLNPNHTGSGSITIPTTLAGCGLNTNVQFVNFFLEAGGANGETSLGFLGTFHP
jgi:hypothetical protein